jgi:predicted nucleic acid-binding protein
VIVYLDTSALVKLVVEEQGSELAARVWDAADVRLTSLITYVEGRAAIAAAHRDRRLGARPSADAASGFVARWSECIRVGISDDLVRMAGDLAADQRLRGYDAIHLASALRAGAADLVFTTWDRSLAAAAKRVGIAVALLTRRA